MPIPLDALLQEMAGNAPRDITERSGGLLVDQGVYGGQGDLPMPRPNPPLTLRDQNVYPGEFTAGEGARQVYPNYFPLLKAGDVVPFGGKAGPFQGPTNQSVDFMLGRATDPKIAPVNPDPKFWEQWMNRQLNRQKMQDMGVPYG